VAHAKVDRVCRCFAGGGLNVEAGEEDAACKEEELLSANGIATNLSRPLFEGNGHLGFGDENADVHWAQEEWAEDGGGQEWVGWGQVGWGCRAWWRDKEQDRKSPAKSSPEGASERTWSSNSNSPSNREGAVC
jgi:hypothetical protein